jgi:hypothetical protein
MKNKQAYFQGTKDLKEKVKSDKLPAPRVELDTRPPTVYTEFKNYDYTDEGPNETSLGGGLYHGPMDKYKSVKDFLDKWRSDVKKRADRLDSRIKKFSKMLGV